MAEAGKFLLETSAQEERFARLQDLEKKGMEAHRKRSESMVKASSEANEAMKRQQKEQADAIAGPQSEASPKVQATCVNALAQCFE